MLFSGLYKPTLSGMFPKWGMDERGLGGIISKWGMDKPALVAIFPQNLFFNP